MSNSSGITPVGLSILVLPKQVEEKVNGIYVGTPTEIERLQLSETDGVVVAIGPRAFYDEVDSEGKVVPRCKIGDRVIMKAYAGMIKKGTDGQKYRLIADSEIIGILENSENE